MPADAKLAHVLAEIRSKNREIQELDSRLSSLIGEIEEALRLHVNLRISVSLTDNEKLAFGKTGGQWRLIVESEAGETALASCSRERRVRVFATQSVERLLASAASQIDDFIAERKDVLARADVLIAALKGQP